MSWKKHFTVYHGEQITNDPSEKKKKNGSMAQSRFQSWLPEVYSGMSNRVERYVQFDQMDMDSEINAALDTIAEFSSQIDEETETPFMIHYHSDPTESEASVIGEALTQWSNLNDWDKRMFRTLRNTFKYGDQPFIRDPETWILHYVNPSDVGKIIVDEAKGKEPAQYIIKNVSLNVANKTATDPLPYSDYSNNKSGISSSGLTAMNSRGADISSTGDPSEETTVDATHVIHVSLSEGMDPNYPFGSSILDPIFKTYKQKELLEDAIIIYRVQRAPERRVFYIDTGDMPPHRAMAFVERVKNEVHQRRIPNKNGGGQSMLDAQYNPMCLALDTRIPLLDGRTLPLSELIEEYQSGKENWAYSCNPETGEVVPGVISWAGVTRKDADVIEIELDNGKTLKVTPDHKIPVFGKGFVEAQDITPEDSLISFNVDKEELASSTKGRTYTKVYDHHKKDWVFVHRMVAGFFRHINQHQEFTYMIDGHKNTIHHADFNRYNNDPRNLQWMSQEDHLKYHQDQNFWQHFSDEQKDEVKQKISETLKSNWKEMSDDDKDAIRTKMERVRSLAIHARQNDPVVIERYAKKMRKIRLEYFEKNPDAKEKLVKSAKTYAQNYPNQKKVYTFRTIQIVAEVVKSGITRKVDVINALSNNDEFLEEVRSNNQPIDGKNFKILLDKVTNESLDRLLHKFGYYNWKKFVKEVDNFNHRIVRITKSEEKEDVGTITIDGKERWHDYHTFAVDAGIFVKNSILEDYFFSQSADGRGSKVDVLPGGEQLGEIDDLKFFTNKMMRALRVPSSYMPTGPEDGTATFNDGRVGTAFIQEFRFTQFCKRLQNLVQPTMDREFKLFLKHRGYNIDSGMFDIRLTEPQSFSQYRQIDIDSARAGLFSQIGESSYISKRFALKKYLGLSEAEILENEKMWMEENKDKLNGTDTDLDQDDVSDLGSMGISPADEDFGGEEFGDEDFGDEDFGDDESPISGAEGEEGGDIDPEET